MMIQITPNTSGKEHQDGLRANIKGTLRWAVFTRAGELLDQGEGSSCAPRDGELDEMTTAVREYAIDQITAPLVAKRWVLVALAKGAHFNASLKAVKRMGGKYNGDGSWSIQTDASDAELTNLGFKILHPGQYDFYDGEVQY